MKTSNVARAMPTGPHKTGTTSIQNNLMKWTSPDQNIIKHWEWPVPSEVIEIETKDEQNWRWNAGKGFYALSESLRDSQHYQIKGRKLFLHYSSNELLKFYKTEFLKTWVKGKNIVFGSEAFDFIIKDINGVDMINGLKALMPWRIDDININGSDNDITVVVTYRLSRIKHLISIWRQTKKETEPFEKWMKTTLNNLGALDSLGLANAFILQNLKVSLLDSSGLAAEGVDISNAVACDVLDAPCTNDKQLVGTKPVVMNTKVDFQGKVNLSEEQLDEMDKALQMYDCKYQSMVMEDNRLTILYPHGLLKVFDFCNSNGLQEYNVDRDELKRQLQCIASGFRGCLDKHLS